MSSPALPIMDSQVMRELTAFCAGFKSRHRLQPPEFSHPQCWYGAKDIYDNYSIGIRGSPWFQGLLTSAQELDLAGLDSLADINGDGYQFCMIRCIQFALLDAALARDRAYKAVSVAIPRYFRRKGWSVPGTWKCEIQADNEAFLARQDAAIRAALDAAPPPAPATVEVAQEEAKRGIFDIRPCRSCSAYFRMSQSADGDHCSAACSAHCPPYSAVPLGMDQPRPASAAEWMAFNGTRAPSPPASPTLVPAAAGGSV